MTGGRRWLTDDRLTELVNSGRIREVTRIGKPLPGPHWSDNVAPAPVQCRQEPARRKAAAVPIHRSNSCAAPIRGRWIQAELPWPPSGNHSVNHTASGAHFLRPEVVEYRQRVAGILAHVDPIVGRYDLVVELSPPDDRRRDADNALKQLLDASVKAGWLPEDSMHYLCKLMVTVTDDRRGVATVRAIEVEGEAA